MRISDIQIDRYGICENVSFEDFKSPFIVVYGPNEAGKTTTMEFIRNTMFGATTTVDRLHNLTDGGHAGGDIRAYDQEGNHWTISRSYGEQAKLEISINGQLHPNSSLNRDLLGGVGPNVFRNVFTVGIGELQQLSQLNATEAADFLYDMTTGYDRVSLGSVLRGITIGRESIFDEDGVGTLADNQARSVKIKHELQRYQKRITEWSSTFNGLRSAKKSIGDLKAKEEILRERQRALEACLEIYNLATELTQLEQFMSANHRVVTLSAKPEFRESQDISKHALEAQSAHLTVLDLEEQILQATVTRDSLAEQQAPQDLRLRLQAFTEMLPWIESLQRELSELGERTGKVILDSSLSRLKGKDEEVLDLTALNRKLLKELRLPARELKRSQKRLQNARKEVDDLVAKCVEAERAWLDDPSWNEVALIPNLERPSFCLTDGIREQRRKLKELEQLERSSVRVEPNPVPETNPLPRDVSNLILGATVFSVGGTLLGMGLLFPSSFGLSTGASVFCSLIGCLGIGGGVLTQIREQKLITQRKQQVARKLELAKIRQASEFIDGTTKTNDLNSFRQDSEENRQQLDLLLALNKQASVIERLRISQQAAVERLSMAEDASAESQSDWESRLQTNGIAEHLTPSELYAAVERVDDLDAIKRLQLNHDSKARRTRIEFAELELRLTALLTEFDEGYSTLAVADKLRLLEALGHEQEGMRKELANADKLISALAEQLRFQDDVTATANRRMVSELATFGVSTMYEMDKLFQLASTCQDKTVRLAQIQEQIGLICAGHKCDLPTVLGLASEPISEIELQWDKNERELETAEKELAELNQLIGSLKTETAHISDPGDLKLLRLQSAALDCEAKMLKNNWKVWATSEIVSSRVRDNYETQRQPETLRDASQWLEDITAGAYTRIWTPLGEDLLYVDDGSGQSWSIDSLSRGTRESIFLSLRLALVRAYQNEGVSLPLILDDVLVNYDLGRAQNAIGALRRFADEVGQVLFFTCHQHIATSFGNAQADVRKIDRPEKVVAPKLLRLASTNKYSQPLSPADNSVEFDPNVNSIAGQLTRDSSGNAGAEADEFGDEIEIEIVPDEPAEVDPNYTEHDEEDLNHEIPETESDSEHRGGSFDIVDEEEVDEEEVDEEEVDEEEADEEEADEYIKLEDEWEDDDGDEDEWDEGEDWKEDQAA